MLSNAYSRLRSRAGTRRAREPDLTGILQSIIVKFCCYFNGDQVLSCEGTGVAPVVPKTLTSGNTKRGLFTGQVSTPERNCIGGRSKYTSQAEMAGPCSAQ